MINHDGLYTHREISLFLIIQNLINDNILYNELINVIFKNKCV